MFNPQHFEKISLWFVRHGESEGNALDDDCPVMHDTSLNQNGIRESESIAAYFKKHNARVAGIYSASLERDRHTADIIARGLGLTARIEERLGERNWGDWAALTWRNVSEKLEMMPIEERYMFVPKGGESWKQMEQRLFAALEDIIRVHKAGDNIIIVTHRGCLRAIFPVLAGTGKTQHEKFSVPTGSLTKFSHGKLEFIGAHPDA